MRKLNFNIKQAKLDPNFRGASTLPSTRRTSKALGLLFLALSFSFNLHTNANEKSLPETVQENQESQTAPNQGEGTPVVFETLGALKSMSPQTFVPKTFYYGNANDDPAATPEVGEDQNIKYIKICATGGNPPKMADTISLLHRWVRIPENAPKSISIEFKTKITKSKDFDWQATEGAKEPERRNEMTVSFMKENGKSGGGIKVGREKFKEIDQWVTHSHTIKIPEGAKYLHISLETSGAYCLWLGDWKIK